MNKQLAALIAAVLMTACIGAAIFAIGGVAMFNQSGAVAANSNTQASQVTNVSVAQQNQAQQAQSQQYQALIAQYQAREQQYQQREQQYQQQLAQANSQVQAAQQQMQQVQMLLNTLQQQGIITISSDGRIFINR